MLIELRNTGDIQPYQGNPRVNDPAVDAEFNLDLLGFDAEALAKLLDRGVQDGLTDPDEVPAPPDEAVTCPGDLYILGDHRLLCGDSAKAEDVDRLLDGAPVHRVNTDPPYGVKVAPRSGNAMVTAQAKKKYTGQQGMDAKLRGLVHATTEKMRPKDRPLVNDFISDEEFARMLRAWFGNIQRVLLPGRAVNRLGHLKYNRHFVIVSISYDRRSEVGGRGGVGCTSEQVRPTLLAAVSHPSRQAAPRRPPIPVRA